MNKYLHIPKDPIFLSHVIHYVGMVTSRFRFFLGGAGIWEFR